MPSSQFTLPHILPGEMCTKLRAIIKSDSEEGPTMEKKNIGLQTTGKGREMSVTMCVQQK